MGKKLVFLLAFVFILAGCQKADPAAVSYVTQVRVSGWHRYKPLDGVYTDSKSMSEVLNYLRLVQVRERYGEEPVDPAGSDFTVTLTMNDGKKQTYRLYGDAFISRNGGAWHRLDVKRAGKGSVL